MDKCKTAIVIYATDERCTWCQESLRQGNLTDSGRSRKAPQESDHGTESQRVSRSKEKNWERGRGENVPGS